MEQWFNKVPRVTRDEIVMYTADPEWQKFRVQLKGGHTRMKLTFLARWLYTHRHSRKSEVQVANYINALVRAGALRKTFDPAINDVTYVVVK